MITRADSGKTLRQVRTAWSDAWAADDAPPPLKMRYQDILVGDVLGQIERHRVEPLMHATAGQSIAYFDEMTTVADVMDELVTEANDVIVRLTGN